LLFDLGLDERGAQLIAHNFKNLTLLSISKHLNDSDSNYIGNLGVLVLANVLKNLTTLSIGKG
jgi:hypothetical protein